MLGGLGRAIAGTTGSSGRDPRLGQRIQSQRVEHCAHGEQRLTHFGLHGLGIGAIGKLREQRIAGTNGGENRGGRAGDVDIVVHRGHEIGGQVIGGYAGNLFAGRLTTQGHAGTLDEVRDAVVCGLSLDQCLIGPFEHRTILHGTQRVTHHPSGVLSQHRRHGQASAERLRHLLALGGHPSRVHPVCGGRVASRTGLGHLVLMVREAQVQAAAVNVESVAQITMGHGRAFDMPARTSHAERG